MPARRRGSPTDYLPPRDTTPPRAPTPQKVDEVSDQELNDRLNLALMGRPEGQFTLKIAQLSHGTVAITQNSLGQCLSSHQRQA